MNLKQYLKEKIDLSKDDSLTLIKIENKFISNFENIDKFKTDFQEITTPMYQAYFIDKEKYINKIFFEFYNLRKKTLINLKRIYSELDELINFENNSISESNHLINIYRSIVSDLFDPYITLLKANFQFIEGNFISIIDSNLGLGERNKYEYCISRMRNTKLFEGYNPIVRNAISHTGSDSIIIKDENISFRNIKRGNPPIVTNISWTTEKLKNNIVSLLNLINLIDLAIDLFGFDIVEVIKLNKNLNHKFLDEILETEDRLMLQEKFDFVIRKINENEEFSEQEKLDALTTFFFIECKKRDLEVIRNAFNTQYKKVFILIPKSENNSDSNEKIFYRCLEMLRFGILAEPCYKGWVKLISVIEVDEENNEYCKLEGNIKYFDEYNIEKASLLDLANDLDFYYKNEIIHFKVDFDKLKELEEVSLERIFPRKKR